MLNFFLPSTQYLVRALTLTYINTNPTHSHTNSLTHTQCCSCSVFTVCSTCNAISPSQCVLYLYISTFRGLCAAHNMAVFCSSLISPLPGVSLSATFRQFQSPYHYRYHSVFTVHIRSISVAP